MKPVSKLNSFGNYFSTLLLDPMPKFGPFIIHTALVVWLLIVLDVSLQHEMWRDEVRALLMATEAESFWGLFSVLRNEGHPLLWYAILRFAHNIFQTPAVLQVTSIIVAFMGITLFVKRSPFSLIIKLAFIFGVIPLFEFSVSARNYGISMLLLFLLAHVYTSAPKKHWQIGAIIALLANTNYLALVFSVLFTGFWILESRSSITAKKSEIPLFTGAVLLAVLGIGISYLTIAMDGNSSQATPDYVYGLNYFDHLLKAITHPGAFLGSIFNPPLYIRDLVVLGFLIGLIVRPLAFLTLLAAFLAFNTLAGSILTPQLRHQGVIYVMVITFFWIVLADLRAKPGNGMLLKTGKTLTYTVIYLILLPFMIVNIGYAQAKISEDVSRELSSAKAFGAFLNTNFQFHDAIIIGEPDYLIQSLPYYARNRIYIVREKRFGGYIRYIKGFPEDITLTDILEASEMLMKQYHVPILIALKHWHMTDNDTYSETHKYGRGFKTNRQEIARFIDQTIKIAEFNNAVSDENYRFFLIPKDHDIRAYLKKYGHLNYQTTDF